MKRILLILAAVPLTATAADAGPIRNAVANWRASRGGCQTGQCQPQQVQQYTPGPVVTAAGTVLVQTGQVIQQAGQNVQQWSGLGLVRPTTCVGGVCR